MTLGYVDTTFLATMGYGTHSPSDPIVFDVAVQNTGGHYDPTSGIYTAPIDGTYEFIIHTVSANDWVIATYLVVDDTQVSILADENIITSFCGICLVIISEWPRFYPVMIREVKKNGIYIFTICNTFQITYTVAYGDTTYDERLLESVLVLSLTAGRQVWVRPSGITTMHGSYSSGMYSWFSGHLVHAL